MNKSTRVSVSTQFKLDILAVSGFLAMGAIMAQDLTSEAVFRSNLAGLAIGMGIGYAMRAFLLAKKKAAGDETTSA